MDKAKLEALAKLLRDEQRKLLMAAAEHTAMPHNRVLERVAQLELNISYQRPAELTREGFPDRL